MATVNTELQTKLADLSRANNDMNNLLAGTGIGTVFVDHKLHILRFTPSISRIINLIQSDIGRPVGHIVSNLVGYDNLVADIRAVLETLVAKEVEVQTRSGPWYTMRIQPYRTLDNVIEGAVLTFVDISEKVQAEEALRKATSRSHQTLVLQDSRDAMIVLAPDGRILAWNPAAAAVYGWSEEEALAMNIGDLLPEGLRDEELARVQRLGLAESLEPHPTERKTKDGRVVDVVMVATALRDSEGQMYALTTLERVKGIELMQ
jgi:two-component system CheB/CheR fusion protein